MKKFKLALLASSMFTTFIINAQTVTNAWNGAPSNCDTGCAQSNLVGVSGTVSARRTDGNTATAILMVVEFP